MSDSTSHRRPPKSDIVRDAIIWRRKKVAFTVLVVSTATWILLDVYQFNFLTVVSWLYMSIVILLFLWGNIRRLLGKEEQKLSRLELSEQFDIEFANYCRELIEDTIRWMFWVSAEREWFLFVRTIVALWFVAYVGSFFDILTLFYLGVVVGMTVPAIYVKNEERINKGWEWMKAKSKRVYHMVDEKVIMNMKRKLVREHKKEKKKE
ncbi:reticulon-like protein B13 [Carica papaya]|uniref:reticulon-like protein B13 n=1 Tax=Carica papaya TaxID=3649 RepID=UPI000B8CD22C|nr:reticulon-like protein B13 [Carica papaya]